MNIYWDGTEQNLPKAAKTFTTYGYELNQNDGAYALLAEANNLINTVCDDINNIANNYVTLQGMYMAFTGFNDAMVANTQALNNNFAAIKTEFQNLLTQLNTMVQQGEQQDAATMAGLADINQGLGALDAGVDAGYTSPVANQTLQDMASQYQSYIPDSNAEAQQAALAAQQAAIAAQQAQYEAGFIPSTVPSGATAGGFVMPAGDQLETVYKIIAAEGGNISPNEACNIASTMINRARSGGWYGGNDIYKIATAKHQYVVYETGKYKSASLSPESRAAVDQLFASAAMGGATAHNYSSFRSHGSTGYKGTVLEPGGNRYA